jgi:hypothetical protein
MLYIPSVGIILYGLTLTVCWPAYFGEGDEILWNEEDVQAAIGSVPACTRARDRGCCPCLDRQHEGVKTEASLLLVGDEPAEAREGKRVRFNVPDEDEDGSGGVTTPSRLRTALGAFAEWLGSLPGRVKASHFQAEQCFKRSPPGVEQGSTAF